MSSVSTRHVSILLSEMTDPVIRCAQDAAGGPAPAGATQAWVVDATLGGGGHTAALLRGLEGSGIGVLAFDRDAEAITRARVRFAVELASQRLELVHAPFSQIATATEGRPVLGLIADLGFSSDQIDAPGRGFSFRLEGPLDMRMDPSQGESAHALLRRLSEREIADLLWEYGEERLSRRIARKIVEARAEGKLPATTVAFAELIAQAVPRGGDRIHPATRSFQALRIAVNAELSELDALLEHGIMLLQPGAGVAILTFHSLEDRKVKQRLRADDLELLSKKALVASDAEIAANPRARSAKLRIARKRAGSEPAVPLTGKARWEARKARKASAR